MRAEDLRVREELIQSGEMDGTRYVPRMEAVHRANAARLRQIIADYGWPDIYLVGLDGTLAAWFVAQHAIGEPDFQREALRLVQQKVKMPGCRQPKKLTCTIELLLMKDVLNVTERKACPAPTANTAAG